MEQYVLGLDGGGTKTLAVAQTENGRELFRLEGGSLNPNGETPQAVRQALVSLLRQAGSAAGPQRRLAALCIGAAGVSNPSAQALLRQALAEFGFTGPASITGDHVIALAGALGKPQGMILIAGTGSICFGRTADGREGRAGGRGHLIDDEGSGYALGRDVLRAVVRAQDGRAPATCLAPAVYQALGLHSMEELIAFVYTPGRPKRDIAALARLLPAAAQAQDTAALAIYRHAAQQLAQLACAVADQLALAAGPLALAGGVLQKDAVLCEAFIQHLAAVRRGLTPVAPLQDAACGAALLARGLLAQQREGTR